MLERTAADIAAIDHIITQLGRMIADAARVAESQQAAAEGSFGTSRSAKYYEAAEFNQALAARLADVVELTKEHFFGAGKYPGVPGDGWCDNEDDRWVHCSDGMMRMLADDTDAQSPVGLENQYGPLERLLEELPDAHSCANCSGIDPDTCLLNGEKEN